MYNKLVKLRNKKAFTLVEMLAVIAIVAVLVAIVVPIVGKSTTKARAATNAANLRAIEGKLSTARVSDPDLFLDAVDKLGAPWDTLIETSEALNNLFSSSWWWEGVKDKTGITSTKNLIDYKLCHFTDEDKDGIIEISGSGTKTFTLYDVPLSVGVSASGNPGMEVPEGTPMTIWISNNSVVATYETVGGAYTSADFAIVAETGVFNGTPSGGDTAAALECATGHKGPYTNLGESGHRCEHCGATLGHKLIAGNCMAQGCDFACQHTSGTWTDSSDLGHVCSVCESLLSFKNHSYDKDADNPTGVCTAEGCGHKCSHKALGASLFTKSGDEYVCSNCGFRCSHQYTKYSKRCDVCGFVQSHVHTNQWGDNNSVCSDCGAIKQITTTGCSEACTSYKYAKTEWLVACCTCGHAEGDHKEITTVICSKDNYEATSRSDNTCVNCTHKHSRYTDYKETTYGACEHTESTTTWIEPTQ